MVDAKEKDKAPKSELGLREDAIEKDKPPLNLSNNMAEEEDDDDEDASEYDDGEEEENDDDDDDDDDDGEEDEDAEEEEEEADDEEPEEEREEEKVNDGGKEIVEVKNEGLETSKENAVKEDGNKGEGPKSDEKSGASLKSKEKRPRSRNTKKKEQNANGDKSELSNKKKAANGEKPESSKKKKAANGDKPESSNKKKGSKKVASMGMVFMCSSKTKADCFRYKILGLPESKKDQVLKIYEGMRVFLFDVDLRLMYGIFKAAGPGGYNIEPKAFKSEFPSQVRFTVFDDCLPLAEENFKSVLKENYYSRNKFEGLLNSEQVRKLCALFVKKSRGGRSRSRRSRRTRPAEIRRSRPDETLRTRLDDRRASRAEEKRKRRTRDEERRPLSPPPREKRRYTDYDLYDRDPLISRYLPVPPQPTAIASPVRLYTYERQPLDGLPYNRDHVPEPLTYRVVDRERERDPYLVYSRERQPPPPLYREPVYTVPPTEYHLVSREYHRPSAVEAPAYSLSGGSRVPSYRDVDTVSDLRSTARLPEYLSRTHYRY